MKRDIKISLSALSVFLFIFVSSAAAEINVFACEPEWASLVKELGGDKVSVYTATTAFQDPHHVQARPSLIAKMRRADLLICTGSGLETGWLPVLLRQSGNDRVQPGQPGYFLATDYVATIGKPEVVDRSQGDVHPEGNPHIHTDPRNILAVAKTLAHRMAQIDTVQAAVYTSRLDDFQQRWQQALQRWEQQASPLRGIRIVVHHNSWAYLLDWLAIESVATLESTPGVPPGAGHLSEVLTQLREQPAKMIIRAAYQQGHADEWLSKRAGIPAIVLPFTTGGTDATADLFGLFDDTISRLLAGAK